MEPVILPGACSVFGDKASAPERMVVAFNWDSSIKKMARIQISGCFALNLCVMKKIYQILICCQLWRHKC